MGSLDTGGAEMMVVSAAEALAGQCTVDYLVFNDRAGGVHIGALEERARNAGGTVLRVDPLRKSGPVKFVSELTELLEGRDYDALHSHINLASGLVMKAARAADIPIRIVHSHITKPAPRSIPWRIYGALSRHLLRRYSTGFAACSDVAGRTLFGDTWAKRHGTVIPNGVKVDLFLHARDHRDAVRGELGLAPDQFVVGMVARFFPQKNHQFMLDVLALDKARGGDAFLLLIGDGPLRSDLEEKIADLGLGDRVRLLGLRTDVPRLLGALDLMAMPSRYEGVPVSLVECQAAGVPAVVSDAVTTDCDLGLDLITWLSLESPEPWQRQLERQVRPPTPDLVAERVAAAGYDVESSARRLLSLYR
ncbi:MAG: glycosyltransferase [Propionibacteriales bacterium]|nr:glycosyltransferase [Propionibacteriales bacterium]